CRGPARMATMRWGRLPGLSRQSWPCGVVRRMAPGEEQEKCHEPQCGIAKKRRRGRAKMRDAWQRLQARPGEGCLRAENGPSPPGQGSGIRLHLGSHVRRQLGVAPPITEALAGVR